MYDRILVPLDGSELAKRVLPYVRLLAKPMGSRITLLRVIRRHPPKVTEDLNPKLHVHHTVAHKLEDARAYVSGLATDLESEGFEVEILVRDGNAGSEIIKEAKIEARTLVAMSSHGRFGLLRFLLGSVTDEILHGSDIPMFIVGPKVTWENITGPKIDREIVALDGSAFSEKVLPHAVNVANALEAQLVLAKVTLAEGLSYYGPDLNDGNEEFPPEDLDAKAKRYLGEIARSLDLRKTSKIKKLVLHGQDTNAAIIRYAEEAGGSVIALATHARTGLARSLIGSMADRLIQESPYPLLLLHATEQPEENIFKTFAAADGENKQ